MLRLFFILCVLGSLAAMEQSTIRSYEYWFDGNYTDRQQQAITAAAQYTLNTSISAAALSEGLHVLNLRFKDDSARYSSTINQFFYNSATGSLSSADINAYQYWFDNNFAAATLQAVTATPTLNLNIAPSAASLNNGLHLFYIRFRDNSNQWSSTISQFFYNAYPTVTGGSNQVNAYQYWFDGQFGQAQTVAVNPVEQFQLSAALPASSLTKGLHTLQLRFRDKANQWSSTISQFLYIPGAAITASNAMSKMQYWFDNHFDSAVTRTIAVQPVVMITDLLSAATLPDGLHTLQLRFADTLGQWSNTISQFFYKSAAVSVTTNVVTGYRYWFNNDDTTKMVVHNTTPQNILLLNTNIDMGCLTVGDNRLHMQFTNAKGLWSAALTDTITLSTIPPSNTYRFTGNGNWSNAANWQNNAVPALDLPGCKEIIIDHTAGGQCILDVPQYLLKNAKLTVLTGKRLIIPQQLEIK